MLRLLKTNLRNRPVASHWVRRLDTSIESIDRGTSWMEIRTKLRDTELTESSAIPTRWYLQWRRDRPDGEWKVTQVKCERLMTWQPGCSVWH